jgi:Polysaccharide lyase
MMARETMSILEPCRSRPTVFLSLLLAVIVATGAESTQVAAIDVKAADTVFFDGNPNATRNLKPWDHIQVGGDNFPVSARPDGTEKPGTVRAVPDPLGQQGWVYELTVTTEANFAAKSATADRVDLWNNTRRFMGGEGQETWEHFQFMFPANRYHPAPGNWNWLVQHHNDSGYKRFVQSGRIVWEYPELVWGVNTEARLPNGKVAAAFFMRIWGGDDTAPGKPTTVYTGEALRYDHWYDLLAHVIWSTDAKTGLVAWWVDGKPIYEAHHATLWTRPDGTRDHVNFEYSNYRRHDTTTSTVYFGRAKLGSSRRAVEY